MLFEPPPAVAIEAAAAVPAAACGATLPAPGSTAGLAPATSRGVTVAHWREGAVPVKAATAAAPAAVAATVPSAPLRRRQDWGNGSTGACSGTCIKKPSDARLGSEP